MRFNKCIQYIYKYIYAYIIKERGKKIAEFINLINNYLFLFFIPFLFYNVWKKRE